MTPFLTLAIVSVLSQPVPLNSSSVCSVTVECVMPQYNFGPARSTFVNLDSGREKYRVSYFGPVKFREPPAEPAPLPKPHKILAIGEQLALLQLRRNDAAFIVARRLKQNGAFHPDIRNFRALIPHGYARKLSGGLHEITAAGTIAAAEIINHYGRLHKLHCYSEGRAAGTHVTGCCICGWETSVRKGSYTQRNLRSRFSDHLMTVRAMEDLTAALKPPAKAT